MKFNFDVLIASYNRPKLLEVCLDSVFRNKTEELSHVIVLTQREDVETINLLKSYQDRLKIKIVEVDKKLPPGASRNRLVTNSDAEYVFFLDDDAFLSDGYFRKIQNIFSKNKYEVIGGPDQSPKEDGLKQIILGKVLASSFVMGPTYKRHSNLENDIQEADESILTLCNLWVKRNLFDKETKFDENIMRCEENLFLEKLSEKSVKMNYVSDLFIYHKRREKVFDLAMIQFKSGYYRGITASIDKKTFKPFFYIPLITGVLLIILPVLPQGFSNSLIFIHCLISAYISINIMLEIKKIEGFYFSWALIVIIHIFFSIGLVFGFIKGRLLDEK